MKLEYTRKMTGIRAILGYLPKTNNFYFDVVAISCIRDAQRDGRTYGHCEFNICTSYLVHFSFSSYFVYLSIFFLHVSLSFVSLLIYIFLLGVYLFVSISIFLPSFTVRLPFYAPSQ
jgi:hypothetical protein